MECEAQSEHAPPPRSRRVSALLVGLGVVVILGIAAWLSPSVDGVGTHRQLGLPQCGWIVAADLPCPTCGMTTAFSLSVRGRFISAFTTQPFGMLLAIGVACTGLLAFSIALTGHPQSAFWYRWMTTKTLFIFAGMAVFAWVYKICAHRGWFV